MGKGRREDGFSGQGRILMRNIGERPARSVDMDVRRGQLGEEEGKTQGFFGNEEEKKKVRGHVTKSAYWRDRQ